MNRAVKIILAIVIVIAVPKVIRAIFFGSRASSPAEAVAQLAQEMNAGLPKKIDAVTTLTKVELDGSVYRIHYTMDPGVVVDPSQRDTYTAVAIKKICSSNMRMILDNQMSIEYLYTFSAAGGSEQELAIPVPLGSCK